MRTPKPSFASPTPRAASSASGSVPSLTAAPPQESTSKSPPNPPQNPPTRAFPRNPSLFNHQNPFLPHLPPTFGRNQILSVPDSTRALLEEIVGQFRAPIRYAFAYGSGVFAQSGYDTGGPKPLLDFIFAVNHPAHWHSINLSQNPTHYPLYARTLGSSFISHVQSITPGLWFNAYVPIAGTTIKYGVISVDTLCSDLLNWSTLYTSGRMHKPIRILTNDARVRLTQQVNLASALRVALLTLPESFTQRELFERIAGLSYRGDVRMAKWMPGENRGKVNNIVNKQEEQFRELYHRLATGLPGVHWGSSSSTLQQDVTPQARAAHLRKLPANLFKRLESRFVGLGLEHNKEGDEGAFWVKVGGDDRLAGAIDEELREIVRWPSTVQSVKGIASSGLIKSVKYSAGKVGKWWQGRS